MSIAASVSVGNATATVRKSPHNFSSIGQLKYGCRVSLEDSAKVSSAKKSYSRRMRDHRRPLEVSNRTGEDGRDFPGTVQDAQRLSAAAEELYRLGDGDRFRSQGSVTLNSALNAKGHEKGGHGSFSEVSAKRVPDSNISGEISRVSVDDIMRVVKETESDIITLMQLRERVTEELKSAHYEKEQLQLQVHDLAAHPAGSDPKLKYAVGGDERVRLLEAEVEKLQRRLSETVVDSQAFAKLKEENRVLQESLNVYNQSGGQSLLEAKYQSSLDEINTLRVKLAGAHAEIKKLSRGPGREGARLQENIIELDNNIADMEKQLAEANDTNAELEALKDENLALQEEAAALRVQLAALQKDSSPSSAEGDSQDRTLQRQVVSLKSLLARTVAEKNALLNVRSENIQLHEQVARLEERLRESDAEIQAQLRIYTAEVEDFQASLDGLKSENEFTVNQIPVDEMSWEIWSELLLRIDTLMLDDFLSQEDAKELQLMAWRREKRLVDVYVTLADKADEDLTSGFMEFIQPKKRPGIHIIHIAAEMAPVAKVGGLGDVLTGLSRALQRKGHLVEVILPKYDCMDYSRITNLKELDLELHSVFDGHMHKNKVWSGIVEGLPVYFIEPLHPAKLFWRGKFYSEPDDFRRFTYFCRAAMEFLLQSGKRPDIIHSHDWQTAVVAPLYWEVYVPLGLDSARLAFTCHNFEYQGTENSGAIAACGLSVRDLMRPDRMQDNYFHSRINLLKGGIVFSNVVTTVSPTYAQEVLQPEDGKGLHGTLANHSKKFFGVLNGIDVEVWNPATDTLIDFQYSADDIDGKYINKQKLRERLGLGNQGGDERRPLVGCVTRLVPQKGVHLIKHAIYHTLEKGGQFILLGSSPIPQIQHEFEKISRQFKEHPQVRLVLKYDEALSHEIFAAADIFLIPSIFEPCGLTQMISMRYGTIPVVRKTGGLADSVFDVDDENISEEKKNGFVFDDANEGSLDWGLDRALDYYCRRPEWWEDLVKKAMLIDFSWETSADQYVDLYKHLLKNAQAAKQ